MMLPSPVRLTMRPWWSAMVGSMRSLRSALKPRQGAVLVRPSESAVSDDVGNQDRRELPGLGHWTPPGLGEMYHDFRPQAA